MSRVFRMWFEKDDQSKPCHTFLMRARIIMGDPNVAASNT